MLIMHELADLGTVGDVVSPQRIQAVGLLTKSQVKVIDNQAVTSIGAVGQAVGLTAIERELATSLGRGEALWKFGNRSFLVHTDPADLELAVFSTDARRAE